MESRQKPISVKVPCTLPHETYADKFVMRKARITIKEYEIISRLSRESAKARMRLLDIEESDDKVEERDKLRDKVEATSLALREEYSQVIVEWNLTDDFGNPLPDPYLNSAALGDDVLSMDEYRWITELVQDGLAEIQERAGKTLEGKNSQGS